MHLELANLSISGNAKVVTMGGASGKAAEIKEHELSLPGQVNSLHTEWPTLKRRETSLNVPQPPPTLYVRDRNYPETRNQD